MRRPLLLAATMLALPAAAQAETWSDAPISDSLPPPAVIDRGTEALSRVLDGLLQVDVGPVANAIDPSRHRGPETIGDLAGRDDPYFRERMHRSVGAMADSMVMLSERFRKLEPVLRDSLKDISRNVEDAMRDVPSGRRDRDYYDPDY